ncbi:D-alanyl-D-alanine carboxypeptidase/D-alanyl-D-alanine-endopeptidase [Emticicia sp. BO119]|uniref:D-alanyl-D-alanine carboxypeptidase/D-alanyl-D-alanine endopeptidase n=1 Tax=Emticicia sp. BO119 TaxID=2757768 RepID=UPI0015F05140|nr:D-alanyl-D-alanine carboxypeptidase/D-alanyl-D-alanine-endopeptidase [Emticicia sp. BO119]MBA4849758.1 D-alanyl-D-alanine carboxypeptidase/D-alanyl-D-alanine-endopeptidase [Emticicia sp. BO119]
MKLLLFVLLQLNTPLEKFQQLLDSIQNDNEIQTGVVAASIRSTQTGAYKIQFNARKSVNSASTLKLVSTASALSVLGPDYKYQTFIEYDGTIADSVLKGNIYIRGTGDPSLGSSRVGLDFQQIVNLFARKIKDFGIKKIEGSIIGDGSAFPDNTLANSWVWGDIGNYYGAGISGLNINENLYEIHFKPGKSLGEEALVSRLAPQIPNISYINRVTTAERGSGDNVIVYNTPFSNTIMSEGTVPIGPSDFVVKGSIPDPAYFLAFHVQRKFQELRGEISNEALSYPLYKAKFQKSPSIRNLILSYDSPTISTLAQHCNFQSINLYADAFLKTVGYSLSKDASFEAGVKAEKFLWSGKGVDLQGFMIRDGSGLSPSGVLTANNLVDILFTMRHDSAFNDFYASIPVVGITGTVQNLAKGSKAVGNVRAKSGSIANTRAFSGYYTSRDGELMSFAFIINRYADGADRKVRRYLEEMIKLMVEI